MLCWRISARQCWLFTRYEAKTGRIEGVRVAYSLEQCWHRVPGGTATSAIEIAKAMSVARPDVQLIGVAGNNKGEPASSYAPPIKVQQLALHGAALYETSLRFRAPRVERATGEVDLLHCTSIIPFASRAKMIATIHDLAFLKYPEFFSRRGNSVFRRSLKILLKHAEILLCSSQATLDDCLEFGFSADRLCHVPLGVNAPVVAPNPAQVLSRLGLSGEYLLFVGTLEPRKNLSRLVAALETLGDSVPQLVVVGAAGWGDVQVESMTDNKSKTSTQKSPRVKFLGFVESGDLGVVYSNAEAFCYPSLMEGFGLPILEAMSCGVPVVTSRGSSTQEVAGNAAMLVDPLDLSSIADGVVNALSQRNTLVELGYKRAAEMTWHQSALRTASIYDQVVG